MSTTRFASAVGAVRALESTLLTQSDIDRMISAEDVDEIAGILVSGGRNIPDDHDLLLDALENELVDVWNYITDFAPDSPELKIILYRNDFHNLKAALKTLIMNGDPKSCFVRPSNIPPDTLPDIIAAKDFESLPPYMSDIAAQAYDVLTRTLDGQLTDAMTDAATLAAMQHDAEETGENFIIRYSSLLTVCADIKTAYRCSRMKKNRQFIETAVCGSRELDKNSLVNAALRDTAGFLNWLDTTPYSEAASKLRESTASFEKYCDDLLVSAAEDARMKAFGIEPLAAYYIAKEAELKDVRIILVCKKSGISKEIIMERMRRLYV